MREGHSVSAPTSEWDRVFKHAKEHNITFSEVTRQAWDQFFTEEKNYRRIDVIIVFLLSCLIVLMLIGVWNL